jgi:hypothetical protein
VSAGYRSYKQFDAFSGEVRALVEWAPMPGLLIRTLCQVSVAIATLIYIKPLEQGSCLRVVPQRGSGRWLAACAPDRWIIAWNTSATFAARRTNIDNSPNDPKTPSCVKSFSIWPRRARRRRAAMKNFCPVGSCSLLPELPRSTALYGSLILLSPPEIQNGLYELH